VIFGTTNDAHRSQTSKYATCANHADTTEKALHGALDKIKKVLDTVFENKRIK
jgi:exosome complex RNA-binding protein Rrp42 (RNase PH superfamily)